MTFALPAVLLLLLLVPPGVAALGRIERRRRTALDRFGDAALLAGLSSIPDPRRRMARHAFRLVTLGCLVIAAARPQLGERPALIARAGRDMLVLLDLSRSMNVADAGGTRLAAAKRFGDSLATASPGDRFGLIVFGGSAFVQLPLASNADAFHRFLAAASTDDIGDPSTDVSAALAAAAKAFEHEGDPGARAVLVLSDGESGEGDVSAGLAPLLREGVPVFAIGVGTPRGGPVPADSAEAPERYHRDHIGRVVVSRLEDADLRLAAERTGGVYARWDDAVGRRAVSEGLAGLATRPLASHEAQKPAERFQWPLALAVALTLAEALVPLRGRGNRGSTGQGGLGTMDPRLVGAAASVAGVVLLACGTAMWDARRAERRYDAGDWSGAYESFTRAHEASGDGAFAFDAGNALYRQKHYPDAAARWRTTLADPRLRYRSAFNLGNAAVRSAEDAVGPAKDSLLDDAVASFEEALQLDPTDRDAKWNLEIALRRRGERPGGSSSGRSRRGDYGQGNQNTPGFQGNPEAAVGAMAGGGFGSGGDGESAKELDPSQARQLLDAVQREQLASHLGRRASHPGGGGKDW